jgi:hypothetical protein
VDALLAPWASVARDAVLCWCRIGYGRNTGCKWGVVMAISLGATETLAAAIAVLFIGYAVQTRIGFLRDNNVVGGPLFALVTTVS